MKHICILTCILFLSGCITSTPISESKYGPWINSSERATNYRVKHHCALCPTGSRFTYPYIDEDGNTVTDGLQLANEIRGLLAHTDEARTWPINYDKGLRHLGQIAGHRASSYAQAIAPYSFYLVSIQPTIVVLIPHESSEYNLWLKGPRKEPNKSYLTVRREEHLQELPKVFSNRIIDSTLFPYSSSFSVFSPKDGLRPIRIDKNNNEVTVSADGANLLFVREAEKWRVTRRD